MTKRGAEETRRLEEPMRGVEPRSDPMEEKRGGLEERKVDEITRVGEGAGTGDELGG